MPAAVEKTDRGRQRSGAHHDASVPSGKDDGGGGLAENKRPSDMQVIVITAIGIITGGTAQPAQLIRGPR